MAVAKKEMVTRNKDLAFIKLISDALVASGLVITSDTGQMDPNSLPAYNGTISTSYGYIIYKLSDAAQTTRPIFIKMLWMQSTTLNSVGIYPEIQVGTGSDGAGTLTGSFSTAPSTGNPTSFADNITTADPIPHDVFVGGDGSCVILIINADIGTGVGHLCFILDRFRDASGAATTGGVWFMLNSAVNSSAGILKLSVLGQPFSTPTQFFCWPGPAPTGISPDSSGNIPVFPIIFDAQGDIYYSLAALGVSNSDMQSGFMFTKTRLGGSHCYYALGSPMLGNSGGSFAGAGGGFSGMAVLYE